LIYFECSKFKIKFCEEMAALAGRSPVWGHGISLFLTDDGKPAIENNSSIYLLTALNACKV
jgi:hypothetical protein